MQGLQPGKRFNNLPLLQAHSKGFLMAPPTHRQKKQLKKPKNQKTSASQALN